MKNTKTTKKTGTEKPATQVTPEAALEIIKKNDAARKGKKAAKKEPAAAPAKKDGRAGNTAKRATKVKAAKQAKAKSAKSATNGVPKAFSKSAIVIDLISRKGGATLAEIMKATGWQKHSVRGFLSVLGKKGHSIVSTKTDAGERNYAKS